MNDYEAIRRLFGDYCFYTDISDVDGLLSLLTPDFAFTGAFGDHHGHEGMRALHKAISTRPLGMSRHLTLNSVIDLDGETATARSYIVLLSVSDTVGVRFSGGYSDRLVKQDGRWLLKARHIHAHPSDALKPL